MDNRVNKSQYVKALQAQSEVKIPGVPIVNMGMDTERDLVRPEGVYASIEYVPGGKLITIERVCGDCTVHAITIAPSEAASLLEQLKIIC